MHGESIIFLRKQVSRKCGESFRNRSSSSVRHYVINLQPFLIEAYVIYVYCYEIDFGASDELVIVILLGWKQKGVLCRMNLNEVEDQPLARHMINCLQFFYLC